MSMGGDAEAVERFESALVDVHDETRLYAFIQNHRPKTIAASVDSGFAAAMTGLAAAKK